MGLMKSIKHDAGVLAKGLSDAWKDTDIVHGYVAKKQAVRDHFADAKRINAELAAQYAEEHSYENRLLGKIRQEEAKIASLSRNLDRYEHQQIKLEQAEAQKAADAAKAAAEARANANPVSKFFMTIFDDLKIIGRSLKKGWGETTMGQGLDASVIAPIRNHLREVREINAELDAQNEESFGFEASTKRDILQRQENVAEMYLRLEEYLEAKALEEELAAEEAEVEISAPEDEQTESITVDANDKSQEQAPVRQDQQPGYMSFD